jgi:hypothetical protein
MKKEVTLKTQWLKRPSIKKEATLKTQGPQKTSDEKRGNPKNISGSKDLR